MPDEYDNDFAGPLKWWHLPFIAISELVDAQRRLRCRIKGHKLDAKYKIFCERCSRYP